VHPAVYPVFETGLEGVLVVSLYLMILGRVMACLFHQHSNRLQVLACQRVLPYLRPQYRLTTRHPVLHLHNAMLYPKVPRYAVALNCFWSFDSAAPESLLIYLS
jgi:hypothetical protein